MAARMASTKKHSGGKKPRKYDRKKKGFRFKKWEMEQEESKKLQLRYEAIDTSEISSFEDLPLSVKTKIGLQIGHFKAPTEIQRMSIGLTLRGHDVLGAAKTGSGKTLAFLIPILECLFRNRWNAEDGLGALVISPTRELAYQTFEVLCKVGKKHDFSAGLIIGGKDLQTEVERISRTNIVVCTPGRLLQHMDMTADFECSNLQILVLDEADRILDMGFEKTMNAIIENLPPERQTLLFSATQTKSVRDLARLSLKDPKYVAVHQHHEYSTPAQLEQSYVVCDLDQKADLLYSFIRNHRDQKILVFMASCKQVKYMFEAFCKLGAGTTIMSLYGSLHQLRRVAIYNEFCKKEHAVLFATDIAARGLDFPAVNWVVQLDCPEDANTYIHRAGRTARYENGGESLLVLLPSEEEEMVRLLEEKKIPIQQIRVNPNKKMTVQRKLESFCAENLEFKQTAQRCFIAYIKSVYLMKNKKVFDVHKMELDTFALSLGLAVPPRVRFLQREEKRKQLQQQEKQQKQQQKLISKNEPAGKSNEEIKTEISATTSRNTAEDVASEQESSEEESEENSSDEDAEGSGPEDDVPEGSGSEDDVPEDLEDDPAEGSDSDNDEAGFKESLLKDDVQDDSYSGDDELGFKESLLKALRGEGGQSIKKSISRTSKDDDTGVEKERTSSEKNPQSSQKQDSDSGQSSADSSSNEEQSEDEEQGEEEGEDKDEKKTKVAAFHGNSDDEEDDGDLFTVKTDVFGLKDKSKAIIDSDEEFLQADNRVKKEKEEKEESKKPANQIKRAKKLQKKRMTVNTKVVFGDKGEAVQQWPPRQKAVMKSGAGEEDEYEGGLDIDKAREFMCEEDKHDKDAFRQRVKEKHKAKRLKEKEQRQSRGKRGEVDPGVSLDFQGDDTFDPDALPDPMSWDDDGDDDDKESDSRIADVDEGDDDEEEDQTQEKSRSEKKLKRKQDDSEAADKKITKDKKRKTIEKKKSDFGVGMTLAEEEELALHILGNR